jgi:hypothetical protein
MEPEGSLPHSQASANRPYPGLTQSYTLQFTHRVNLSDLCDR